MIGLVLVCMLTSLGCGSDREKGKNKDKDIPRPATTRSAG